MQNGLPFWYVREPPLAECRPARSDRTSLSRRRKSSAASCTSRAESWRRVACVKAAGCVTSSAIRAAAAARAARELVQLFARAVLAAEADSNIRATVWLKLVNNVGFNAVSVLRRMTIRPMLADTAFAFGGAAADDRGTTRRPSDGRRERSRRRCADRVCRPARRREDVDAAGLRAARALELDPILGAVCELGVRYGVETPEVRRAYAVLQRMNLTPK